MSLTLSDDALKQVLAKALLDAINPEERDKLLTQALQNIMVEPNDNRYGGNTKLQAQINAAVMELARDTVKTRLESDEVFKAKLNDIVQVAIQGSLSKLQEEIGEAVIKTISDTLNKVRY